MPFRTQYDSELAGGCFKWRRSKKLNSEPVVMPLGTITDVWFGMFLLALVYVFGFLPSEAVLPLFFRLVSCDPF